MVIRLIRSILYAISLHAYAYVNQNLFSCYRNQGAYKVQMCEAVAVITLLVMDSNYLQCERILVNSEEVKCRLTWRYALYKAEQLAMKTLWG